MFQSKISTDVLHKLNKQLCIVAIKLAFVKQADTLWFRVTDIENRGEK